MPSLERSVRIPEGVEVTVQSKVLSVKGPLGSVSRDFGHASVSITKRDDQVFVGSEAKGKRGESILGTIAKHTENMILGTTKGYHCKMKIVHSHFPITLKVGEDKILIQNFMGERAARVAKVEDRGVKVTIEGNDIFLKGVDVEKVMQTAANLENATRILGKDQRIYLDGIYIVEKGFQVE